MEGSFESHSSSVNRHSFLFSPTAVIHSKERPLTPFPVTVTQPTARAFTTIPQPYRHSSRYSSSPLTFLGIATALILSTTVPQPKRATIHTVLFSHSHSYSNPANPPFLHFPAIFHRSNLKFSHFSEIPFPPKATVSLSLP